MKWILRYLKGTSNYALCFESDNIHVRGYVDSDHAGDRANGEVQLDTSFVLEELL